MFFRRKPKVFCIGRNKTGTTSLEKALKDLGYKVGHQPTAELLMEDWGKRDFRRIIRFCRTADAFQDVPFSLDYTYVALDQAFPGSRFILTIRDSAEQWYDSLTRFHSKKFGIDRLPTHEDLKSATYRAPGWMWRAQQLVYGINESSLYDRSIYMAHYERHTESVLGYFKHRTGDLLVLNLSNSGTMASLCQFLGVEWNGAEIPHLNRSA